MRNLLSERCLILLLIEENNGGFCVVFNEDSVPSIGEIFLSAIVRLFYQLEINRQKS
jgi:hypothetical protein